uniref:ATP-dependent RNA helicase n=1 Tax=Syphacia muris TaxID=451379 RepID=A0A0N5A8A6_9BILA
MTAFEELGVLPELGQAVDEMGWNLPSDIQSEGIPAILGGGDVLMAAETGSGKTGAFCLPVLQIVWETLRDQMSGKKHNLPSGRLLKKSSFLTALSDIYFYVYFLKRCNNHFYSCLDKKWKLNENDRDNNLAIDKDGLLCSSCDPQKWLGARCNHGVVGKGKYYYEGYVASDGLCRLGWSTPDASLNLGTDRFGFGYGGTGKKSCNKQFDNYGKSFTLGDTIGCLLDLDSMTISFAKNGQNYGKAFDIPAQMKNLQFFPAVVLKNAQIRFNYGDSELKYLPEGYVGVCKANFENTVEFLHGSNNSGNKKTPDPNAPACIILEPTKELAEQTNQQIEVFKKNLKDPIVRNVLVVGNVPISEQLKQIAAGVDIITATPGRLLDFVETKKISLLNCRFFILDEADSLASAKNHLSTIERLYAMLPRITPDGARLQMIVCSATLHNFDVKKLADKMMHFPQWVDLKGQDTVPDTVHHVVCKVDAKQDKMWIRIRQQDRIQTDGIHLSDDIRPGSNSAETLSEGTKILKAEYLLKAYLTCSCLHSDRKPDERKRNFEAFKQKMVKFLICTDVAARGIDVRGVPFVINLTLPDEKTNYLHRIGRVGRAERMGLAISLVSAYPEKVWYHTCPSRGLKCNNTKLTSERGCAIWYDELKLLGDIEEHLGVTITQIDSDMVVPLDEFDGKVVYGAKRINAGGSHEGHAVQMSGAVTLLADLERSLQLSYLRMFIESKPGKNER